MAEKSENHLDTNFQERISKKVADFEMKNGVLMPVMGLGTHGIKGDKVAEVIKFAFGVGYRMIDTASVYRNESEIGAALPSLGTERANIFITTKLSARDHGYEAAKAAFERSLRNLRTDYVDLYLIHWPGAKGFKHRDPKHGELRRETWSRLEKLYAAGAVKAVGVSNYTIEHLKEMLTYCTVKPMVNQVEYHPHLVQTELLEFCRSQDILLQSYSTLGGAKTDQIRKDETAAAIARKYGRTSAEQVILQWAIHQGIGVIPKSTNPVHVSANWSARDLTLSEEDVRLLNGRDKKRRYCDLNPELIL